MYQVELTLLQLEVIQELLEKDTYFDKSYKKRINYALSNGRIIKPSCPAPVLVPSSDESGAPFLLSTEIHVDPDVPFCEFCELAQLGLDVSYSCQCKEVF